MTLTLQDRADEQSVLAVQEAGHWGKVWRLDVSRSPGVGRRNAVDRADVRIWNGVVLNPDTANQMGLSQGLVSQRD